MPRTRVETSRAQKVDELLDAAELLFQEHGADVTSTAAVARAAGVSEKTLFWYFPSKDHLLVGVIDRRWQRVVDELRDEGWPSGDFAEDLAAMLRSLRTLRHLLPALHQRAESSTVAAEWRESLRTVTRIQLATGLRSIGVHEGLEEKGDVIAAFFDGVLLRNLDDAQVDALCRVLVQSIQRDEPSATS